MEIYWYVFISIMRFFKLTGVPPASSFHRQDISREVTAESRVSQLLWLGKDSVLSLQEIDNFSAFTYGPTTTQEVTMLRMVRISVTQTVPVIFPVRTSLAFHSSQNY